MDKILVNYERACNKLLAAFIEKYYCDEETSIEDIDYFWIGDNIGGVASIGDNFWGIENLVDAMRYKPSEGVLFDWYYYQLDCYHEDKPVGINMKNYITLHKEKK